MTLVETKIKAKKLFEKVILYGRCFKTPLLDKN